MSSTTDNTVSGIIERWSEAFTRLDATVLASLYSRNAFFFGSNPNLYRGRDGVAAYFDALPRFSGPTVQFTDVRTAAAGPDVINFAATATFLIGKDTEPLSVKITWVIVREEDDWMIVSHHVSSKTPLIQRQVAIAAPLRRR